MANTELREKLVELLDLKVYDDWYCNEDIADFLIANGVTFAKDTNDGGKDLKRLAIGEEN